MPLQQSAPVPLPENIDALLHNPGFTSVFTVDNIIHTTESPLPAAFLNSFSELPAVAAAVFALVQYMVVVMLIVAVRQWGDFIPPNGKYHKRLRDLACLLFSTDGLESIFSLSDFWAKRAPNQSTTSLSSRAIVKDGSVVDKLLDLWNTGIVY